jgi:hypothetical protein
MTDSLAARLSEDGSINVTVAPVEVTDDTEILVGAAHLDTGAALADISSTSDAVARDAAPTMDTARPAR